MKPDPCTYELATVASTSSRKTRFISDGGDHELEDAASGRAVPFETCPHPCGVSK